jgi:hypothetical protein
MRAMTLSLATRCAESLGLLGRRGNGLTLSLNVCPSLLDDPASATRSRARWSTRAPGRKKSSSK